MADPTLDEQIASAEAELARLRALRPAKRGKRGKRGRDRLSARFVVTVKCPPGLKYKLYADGGGLYLKVYASGARCWIFRYSLNHQRHDVGLGAYPEVSLEQARDKRDAYLRGLHDGIDPLTGKREQMVAVRKATRTLSFAACTEAYVKLHEKSWRSTKHAQQFRQSLAQHVFPKFGDLPVSAVDDELVQQVLVPIWGEHPDLGSRLRGRIEVVLDWAQVAGYRPKDARNPARWKGNLDKLLPSGRKAQPKRHFAAMPYDKAPEFVHRLGLDQATSGKALLLGVLTALRTDEVREAPWTEINFDERVWNLPAERMKAGRPHRAPLSEPAIAVLKELRARAPESLYVCASERGDKPIGQQALKQALARLVGKDEATVHGFRSTFRNWCGARTTFPREVAELALSHNIGDETERAYFRDDLFDKRRELMDAWARFLLEPEPAAQVIPLHAASRSA